MPEGARQWVLLASPGGRGQLPELWRIERPPQRVRGAWVVCSGWRAWHQSATLAGTEPIGESGPHLQANHVSLTIPPAHRDRFLVPTGCISPWVVVWFPTMVDIYCQVGGRVR